jgi:hypothetical protein
MLKEFTFRSIKGELTVGISQLAPLKSVTLSELAFLQTNEFIFKLLYD